MSVCECECVSVSVCVCVCVCVCVGGPLGGCGLLGGRQRAQHAPGSVTQRSSVQFGRAQRTVYIKTIHDIVKNNMHDINFIFRICLDQITYSTWIRYTCKMQKNNQ